MTNRTTLVAAENAGRQWIGIDRDENAEQMVLGQLGKLAGQTPEFWRQQVIIRKCFDQHNGWPARDDLGKIPHYKTHFDRLYREQNGICLGCNWHRDAHVMTVDHDWPRSKGGRDNIGNLRVLCSGCNSSKGTKTLAQLIARNKKKGVWNDGVFGGGGHRRNQSEMKDKQFDSILSWLCMAFVLFCFYMSNRSLRKLNEVQMNGYKEIIMQLNDIVDKRQDCYCEPESEEPWN